jgi:phosphoenolpyruvate carboxykinase (ATP)
MALPPRIYAQLLGEKIEKHNVAVWLINTGWSGGPYGEGTRIKLALTRAMIKAVLSGKLSDAETQPDPIFGVHIPVAVPGVPTEILDPRKTWKDSVAYDRKARELAKMFEVNFSENANDAPIQIRNAGPIIKS